MDINTEQPTPDQQAHAELDALADEFGIAPAASAQPGDGQQPAQPMDWRMAAAGLVLIVDRIIAPNWNLDGGEKDALAEGFGQVLGAFFPTTNLDPRVQALLALGGVTLAITAKRTDLTTGKVVPLRAPPPAPPADDERAAA